MGNRGEKGETSFDVAVIGAGPAGMMAAVRAAELGASVVLLEKNHVPGVKLLMTGKERCNITNAEPDARSFVTHFGKNGKFLLSALYHFGVDETIGFFHVHGVKTKVERGGRVFPESDRAKDVQELFLRLIGENNISLISNCKIGGINHKGSMVRSIELHDGREVRAKNFLITTGGCSYPLTGSEGDGYVWARTMGHKIVRPVPSLTPVRVKEYWVRELEGLSLKNVAISVYQNNKKKDERFGEAIFTSNGMSGPIILDMSKDIGRILSSGKAELVIDFKPALERNQLEKRLIREIEENRNRTVRNIMGHLLPKKMIPVFLKSASIPPDTKGHSISKEHRKKILSLLKHFPFEVKGLLGFKKAIITSGGISLNEIDPKTMRSRIVENLFFAGEIIDLDGPTGGYNLQVCWSTGYLAGESAVMSLGKNEFG